MPLKTASITTAPDAIAFLDQFKHEKINNGGY